MDREMEAQRVNKLNLRMCLVTGKQEFRPWQSDHRAHASKPPAILPPQILVSLPSNWRDDTKTHKASSVCKCHCMILHIKYSEGRGGPGAGSCSLHHNYTTLSL